MVGVTLDVADIAELILSVCDAVPRFFTLLVYAWNQI